MTQDAITRQQTIFLVDDDNHLREYLESLLETIKIQVKSFDSASSFLEYYDSRQAGCLISDIMMPHINGLELQEMLKDRDIQIPIIFISAHGDVSMTKTALKKGALDFIEKPINPIELINSVRDALRVNAHHRKKQTEAQTIKARLFFLTAREKQILNQLMEGQTNKNLAKTLNISLRTVETHRNNILKKMHTASFPELVRTLLSSSLFLTY